MITEMKKIDLPLFKKGKVREVYDLGDKLLMSASDRISAFDHILPTLIPDKGKILNQISAFWFAKLDGIIANHLITTNAAKFPDVVNPYRDQFEGRGALVQKTEKISFECIVRGYITGSGWKEYKKSRSICGLHLPDGLVESERLPQPIFTPTTKAEEGEHDENITFEEMAKSLGQGLAETLRTKSIELYKTASTYAESRGFILADTKFEFGMLGGQPILIDEVLTPDSSRFWDANTYKKGQSQNSYDKQFVRDYLEGLKWDKKPPVPSLPDDIVQKTRQKYIDAFEGLTGIKFES